MVHVFAVEVERDAAYAVGGEAVVDLGARRGAAGDCFSVLDLGEATAGAAAAVPVAGAVEREPADTGIGIGAASLVDEVLGL